MFDYYLKMVSQFIDDMRKQKLRCFLTMSGITWGTMSVILLLAMGESLKDASMKSMTGMGADIVIMGGGRTTLLHEGLPPGRPIRLTEEAVGLMEKHVPAIEALSPEMDRYSTLSYGTLRQNYNCIGVLPIYHTLRNITPRKGGRFVDTFDIQNRRRVVFLGNNVYDKFFPGGDDPIGKTIMVDGAPFSVIGVLEKKIQNSSYMTQDANLVFMPYSTFRDVYGYEYIGRIIYRAVNPVNNPVIKKKVFDILGRKLNFSPDDPDALWMWDTTEMSQFFHYFFLGFEAFLLLGGVFTLIVGGIGVANIMYVTVNERRREIGIKSALGATPSLILAQFMLEAFIIMFFGGGFGVVMAWMIVSILSSPALAGMQVFLGKPAIDMTVAIITASLLALIGFASGWSPAKAASDLDPVQALE